MDLTEKEPKLQNEAPDPAEPVHAEEPLPPVPEEDADKQRKKDRRTVRRFLIKLVVVAAAIWLVMSFVFGIRIVSEGSMYPRLCDGDLIVFYRLDKAYEISDIVAFEKEDTFYTARVVAREGDSVSLSKDGRLEVNGHIQEEEVFFPTEAQASGISYPYRVPEDSFFVLGDHRITGKDSRTFGAVAKKDTAGKVISFLRTRNI